MMLPLFEHEDTERARQIIERLLPLTQAYWDENDPEIFKDDPYSVMLVALFSPRTRTEDSRNAMLELLKVAPSPRDVADLIYEQVFEILDRNSVRFPENKAQYVLDGAQKLVAEGDIVPRDLDGLMAYPGLGWKTGLLTLWLAYGIAPQITVDVHVARIGQRLGFVKPTTSDPQKVSRELMAIVPREHWGHWNSIFVYFGKTRCTPSAPRCEECPIYELCERVGVE